MDYKCGRGRLIGDHTISLKLNWYDVDIDQGNWYANGLSM